MVLIDRRSFLKRTAAAGAGLLAAHIPLRSALATNVFREPFLPAVDLVIAKGASPARNVLAAIEALGGLPKFVRPGDRVMIKPNPVGSLPPEQAICTHPEMIEAVVRECLRVGAKEVVVASHDEPRSMHANGTADAVSRAGGILRPLGLAEQFERIVVPRGRLLPEVGLSKDLLDADVFINMPIAKHHAATRFTGSMKNLMGVVWDRLYFHTADIHRCIADATSALRHDLVLMDANHVLLTNGPVGPGKVITPQQVIAGVDPVAVDAFAARFFDLEPLAIPHIAAAYDIGAGEIDVAKLRVKEIDA